LPYRFLEEGKEAAVLEAVYQLARETMRPAAAIMT
jgi:hypothetical protein